jgi:hypothetical protein
MEALATKIRTADAPGGDRQLFGRQVCRGKGEHRVHGTLSEMGMVVASSTLAMGPIAIRSTPTVNRSVHPAKHSSKPSLDSLMISRGGLKRPRLSVPASHRHTDRTA